jgi:hypothetical protein
MDVLGNIDLSIFASYRTPRPGSGAGLLMGILGSLMMLVSVASYTSRKRLEAFQLLGPKQYWLDLHMATGLFGAFLVSFHAAFAWRKIAGLANLAMWGTVASGILLRYFSVRVPEARIRREYLLESLEMPARAAVRELGALEDDPELLRKLDPALNAAVSFGTEPRLVNMGGQFLKDVRAVLVLSTRVRRLRRRSDFEESDGRPDSILIRRLILTRNVIFLKNLENGAEFWWKIHVYLSIFFGIYMGIHLLVVSLFKPRFVF